MGGTTELSSRGFCLEATEILLLKLLGRVIEPSVPPQSGSSLPQVAIDKKPVPELVTCCGPKQGKARGPCKLCSLASLLKHHSLWDKQIEKALWDGQFYMSI